MTNVRKKISELTALESASLDTTIVGVDGGTTYKIELDTLADAVTSRVNILDRDRLSSLESVTSSFETKGRSVISSSAQITTLGFISSSVTIPEGTISSSAQITAFGFVSSSTDISSLNSFTSSQTTLNTAFTNGINARLQTSSFETFSQSVDSRIIAATNEQSFNGLISGSSQLTSSYDSRYVLSGSITQTTWDNIDGKPSGLVSQSTDLTPLNSFTQSIDSRVDGIENLTGSFATTGSNSFSGSQTITGSLIVSSVAVVNGGLTIPTGSTISLTSGSSIFVDSSGAITGSLTGSVFGIGDVTAFSSSVNSRINSITSSTIPTGTISGSSQLTASFDVRYSLSGSGTSGIVNAGTFVTLDNIKATVTTSGQRGLSLATVSGTFACNIGGNYAGSGVGSDGTSGTATITTSASTSIFGWGFTNQGDFANYIITDTTNSKAYRIIIQIGNGFNNNLVSIERLH
jgi:hypothetical protein